VTQGGRVMRFSAKCVSFICVRINKSKERNSDSANNYSRLEKHRGLLKPTLGSRGIRVNYSVCTAVIHSVYALH